MRSTSLMVAILTGVALLGAGCGSSTKAKPAPEVPRVQPTTQETSAPAQSATTVEQEPAVTTSSVPVEGVSTSELPADIQVLNAKGYLKDAFFESDKAELRDDTRELLAANATWLKQYPTVKVLIEGHCDERNTAEYNLALGWRRAFAVRDYLVTLGVDGGRLGVISYGEERPFATGHDEASWAQNRRVHFRITAR
jgi:peptidoglycan-associated lipoprotein